MVPDIDIDIKFRESLAGFNNISLFGPIYNPDGLDKNYIYITSIVNFLGNIGIPRTGFEILYNNQNDFEDEDDEDEDYFEDEDEDIISNAKFNSYLFMTKNIWKKYKIRNSFEINRNISNLYILLI